MPLGDGNVAFPDLQTRSPQKQVKDKDAGFQREAAFFISHLKGIRCHEGLTHSPWSSFRHAVREQMWIAQDRVEAAQQWIDHLPSMCKA